MAFIRSSQSHVGVFAVLLWCNNSSLVWSMCRTNLQHNQNLLAMPAISVHYSNISLHLRGGCCPDEGAGSPLPTTKKNTLSVDEVTENDDADDASLIGQVGDGVAVPHEVSVGTNTHEDIGADLDLDFFNATEVRLAGKEAHDKGDFELAGELFQKAADSLQEKQPGMPSEEYATCRLHQALCYLKSENYDECLEACSDILESEATHSSAVRARAYHRRAKAKLALNDRGGALQDARSAAFLGDRKAVALYGRLMRETPLSVAPSTDGTMGSADFMSSPTSPSAALFESLMSKTSNIDQPGINPASMLFGGDNNNLLNSLDGSGGSSLAKSVITSLNKRLNDESTQTSISKFLQTTNKVQLQQFASIAGIDVPEIVVDRIERVCHGITPTKIRRMLQTTKGAVYVVRIVRRLSRLVQKYKSLLVALALFQWTKSAILRPMPVDRALAKRQAKAALKEGMKANRSGAK